MFGQHAVPAWDASPHMSVACDAVITTMPIAE
jgi:hypothetical protein